MSYRPFRDVPWFYVGAFMYLLAVVALIRWAVLSPFVRRG